MPQDHPIGQVSVYDNLLGEFWHAPPGRELVQPYYLSTNERLPQYRTEQVLRRRLAGLPEVDLWLGWTATTVEQDSASVRLHVVEDGGEKVLTGAYVVGCDGGHSMVRSQADIARSGTDFGELVALVVFRSPEPHEALRRFPERSTYRVMHPDLKGYWMFFGRVDVGEHFFFHAPVPHGSRAEDLDVAELLHRAAGFPFSFDVDHLGFWDLRVQVAARAGHHLPPQPLSCGRNVFEALARHGFTLLAWDADDCAVGAFEAAAGRSGVPLTVVRDTLAGGREAYGSRLVLVRPDHVAWTGDRAPDDVDAVVARVAGRA